MIPLTAAPLPFYFKQALMRILCNVDVKLQATKLPTLLVNMVHRVLAEHCPPNV